MNNTVRVIAALLLLIAPGPLYWFLLNKVEAAAPIFASSFNWPLGITGVLIFTGALMLKASLAPKDAGKKAKKRI